MSAKLIVAAIVFVSPGGQGAEIDVARAFHEVPFASIAECEKASPKMGPEIEAHLRKMLDAYWKPRLSAFNIKTGSACGTKP